jgi:hypothetical protein
MPYRSKLTTKIATMTINFSQAVANRMSQRKTEQDIQIKVE